MLELGRGSNEADGRAFDCSSGAFFYCSGMKLLGTGKLPIAVVNNGEEATVVIDGQETRAAPKKPGHVELDLTGRLHETRVLAGGTIALSVKANFGQGERAGTLEAYDRALCNLGNRRLGDVTKGPVVFAGESGTPKAGVLVGLQGDASNPILVAGAQRPIDVTFGDVERVAVITKKLRYTSCGAYSNKRTSEGVTITFEDLTFDVYERRTGKKVASSRASAPPYRCPTTVTTAYTAFTSSLDDAALKAVLKRLSRH
jgi:hypothetical protein